ncbi:MAG: GNAT family N-acetyltransferase [Firmicutes bacterium]|nr:GNAT family N-acetyltransferase [Bacillota bacterium]
MIKVDKEKFTKEIKTIIKELDDEISCYTSVDISWYDRYRDDSYIYLLKDDKKVIGYIYGTFITESLYNSFINGKILSDFQIDKKLYVDVSDYIYLSSIVIKEEYRNNKYGSLLQEKFLEDNKDKKIVILTVSESGYNLAKKYFKLYKKIDKTHTIFIN